VANDLECAAQYVAERAREDDDADVETMCSDAARGFRLDSEELHEAVLKILRKGKA
jgi:hypothetical protein